MFKFNASGQPKSQIFNFLVRKLHKISCKKLYRKIISLNFGTFSSTFFPRWSEETDFYYELEPGPLILHFLKIFSIWKIPVALQIDFLATQLSNVLEYDIFQKTLFFHFSAKYEFRSRRRFSCSRAVVMKKFYFYFLKDIMFSVFMQF